MITEDDRCEDGSTHLSCINAIINYSCDDDEVGEADEMSMMHPMHDTILSCMQSIHVIKCDRMLLSMMHSMHISDVASCR